MTDRSFNRRRPDGYDPDKRRRLVEAAARAFARAGFDRASVDDIAREAAVAKGTTYLYFANKRALFLAALDELGTRLDTIPSAGSTVTAEQRVRAFVRLHLDVAGQAPDLFRCYTSALFGVNREFQEAALQVFALQAERVETALGRRRSPAARRRAEMVAAATLAAALISGLGPNPARDTSLEEEIILHGAIGRRP